MESLTNRQKLELLKEAQLRKARADFLTFRKVINPKDKWGWWQEEVAQHLQQFVSDLMAGKRPKLVIEAPPQHGKSVQIVDLVAWIAGKYPHLKTIYTSFSDRLGVRANLRLRRIFASEIYREIFPDFGTDWGKSGHSANQSLIEYIGQDGSFRNTTVGGSITGESLDIGIVDDPLKGRKEASSELVRDNAWNWFTDDFFTRFSENAGLLCILTRWHIDDPIGRLLEKNPDIKALKYPALAVVDEPHRKAGEPLFPEHKSLEFLLERKKLMAVANWEALYQQNPTIAEGEMFKPDRIQVVDAIPHGASGFVRGWDFAATAGGGDYTAGVKMAKLPDGRFIILDVVRQQVCTDERDALLKNTASMDGYGTKISIPEDPAAAGKSQALYMVRQLAGFSIEATPESGDKTVRADGFASQVNVGNVIMLRGHWNKGYVEELRPFPFGKYDDQVDASSRSFNHLAGNNFNLESMT